MPIKWCIGAMLALAFSAEASLWNLADFSQPPAISPAPDFAAEGVEAIYYEGPPYQGKSTKVFAYIGFPSGATADSKVPGIILVHGGGGTAFADWVRLWNERGYAAIAMDHDGGLPIGQTGNWKRNPDAGPLFENGWAIDSPTPDQWMYHAVASALLANSLLRSRPEVDPDRIGITGISWGGVITSTVAGIDPRLKFAAPVYGCGFISDPTEDGSQFVGKSLTPEQLTKWRQLWDPSTYLAHASLPMLWVTGTNDFAFTLRSLEKSVRGAQGPQTLSIHLRMEHGQGAGQIPAEIPAFADQIVKNAPPLPRIISSGIDGNQAWVEFESSTPLTSASLLTTRHQGLLQNRVWNSLPIPDAADKKNGRLTAELPRGAKSWFFNLTDQRGLIVSSLPVLASPVSQ